MRTKSIKQQMAEVELGLKKNELVKSDLEIQSIETKAKLIGQIADNLKVITFGVMQWLDEHEIKVTPKRKRGKK